MTDHRSLAVIESDLDPEEIVTRIARLAGGGTAELRQTLYHPFHAWRASGRLRSLAGSRAIRCELVVDALTAEPATVDHLHTISRAVPDGEVLAVAIPERRSHQVARSYMLHVLQKRLRTLGAFDLELSGAGLIYRPCWVVAAGVVRVLVDAVTGSLHPLDVYGSEGAADSSPRSMTSPPTMTRRMSS